MRGKVSSRYAPDRRGGPDEDDEDAQPWLMTYADAVTLLLAFFVLLYSISEIDVHKFSSFVEGLRAPFGTESGTGVLPENDGLTPLPPDPVAEPEELEEQIAELEAQLATFESGVDADTARAAAELAAQQRRLDEIEGDLSDTLEAAGLDDLVERRREERGLVVSIASDDVLFRSGSAEIGEAGLEIVRIIAESLTGVDNLVQVEGHTDDVPLSRDGYTNWNLSTDRAVAVLSSMIEEHGLSPGRVGAVGYGEYRPFTANDTVDGRARNRRVDVVVLLEEPES